MKNYQAAVITGLCSVAAGLLHVSIVAKLHWTPFPPLEGIFFIVGGLMQSILGIQFLRHPTMRTYQLGLTLNGGMAMLCIMMQYLPVPFVGEIETMGLLAVLVVTLELVAVATSLRWLHTYKHHGQTRKLHITVATALSVIVLSGVGYYGGSQGMAMLMPNRSVAHHHGSEGHLPPEVVETGGQRGSINDHEDGDHDNENDHHNDNSDKGDDHHEEGNNHSH